MKISKSVMVSVLLLFSAVGGPIGCATASFGTPITQENVAKIVKGKTTKSDVIALFGSPYNTSILPDGSRYLMYIHTKTSVNWGKDMVDGFKMMAGQEYHSSYNNGQTTLQIYINKAGIVSDYEYSGGN